MAVQLRYINLNDFVNEIPVEIQGLITDDSANSSSKDNDILTQKGIAAEALFESYAGQRYELPVKTADGNVPAQVEQCIYSILKYDLYARRNAVTEAISSQYANTMKWLRDVAAGKANIPFIQSDDTVESDGATPTVTTHGDTDRQFSTSRWV